MSKFKSDKKTTSSRQITPVTTEFAERLHSNIKFFTETVDGSYTLQPKTSAELEQLLQRSQGLN